MGNIKNKTGLSELSLPSKNEKTKGFNKKFIKFKDFIRSNGKVILDIDTNIVGSIDSTLVPALNEVGKDVLGIGNGTLPKIYSAQITEIPEKGMFLLKIQVEVEGADMLRNHEIYFKNGKVSSINTDEKLINFVCESPHYSKTSKIKILEKEKSLESIYKESSDMAIKERLDNIKKIREAYSKSFGVDDIDELVIKYYNFNDKKESLSNIKEDPLIIDHVDKPPIYDDSNLFSIHTGKYTIEISNKALARLIDNGYIIHSVGYMPTSKQKDLNSGIGVIVFKNINPNGRFKYKYLEINNFEIKGVNDYTFGGSFKDIGVFKFDIKNSNKNKMVIEINKNLPKSEIDFKGFEGLDKLYQSIQFDNFLNKKFLPIDFEKIVEKGVNGPDSLFKSLGYKKVIIKQSIEPKSKNGVLTNLVSQYPAVLFGLGPHIQAQEKNFEVCNSGGKPILNVYNHNIGKMLEYDPVDGKIIIKTEPQTDTRVLESDNLLTMPGYKGFKEEVKVERNDVGFILDSVKKIKGYISEIKADIASVKTSIEIINNVINSNSFGEKKTVADVLSIANELDGYTIQDESGNIVKDYSNGVTSSLFLTNKYGNYKLVSKVGDGNFVVSDDGVAEVLSALQRKIGILNDSKNEYQKAISYWSNIIYSIPKSLNLIFTDEFKNKFRQVLGAIYDINIGKNNFVELVGPAGVGKTEIIQDISNKLRIPVEQVTCNPSITAQELMGTIIVKGNKTDFVPGPIVKAMDVGGMLLMDDIHMLSSETAEILKQLSGPDKTISINGNTFRVKYAGVGCRRTKGGLIIEDIKIGSPFENYLNKGDIIKGYTIESLDGKILAQRRLDDSNMFILNGDKSRLKRIYDLKPKDLLEYLKNSIPFLQSLDLGIEGKSQNYILSTELKDGKLIIKIGGYEIPDNIYDFEGICKLTKHGSKMLLSIENGKDGVNSDVEVNSIHTHGFRVVLTSNPREISYHAQGDGNMTLALESRNHFFTINKPSKIEMTTILYNGAINNIPEDKREKFKYVVNKLVNMSLDIEIGAKNMFENYELTLRELKKITKFIAKYSFENDFMTIPQVLKYTLLDTAMSEQVRGIITTSISKNFEITEKELINQSFIKKGKELETIKKEGGKVFVKNFATGKTIEIKCFDSSLIFKRRKEVADIINKINEKISVNESKLFALGKLQENKPTIERSDKIKNINKDIRKLKDNLSEFKSELDNIENVVKEIKPSQNIVLTESSIDVIVKMLMYYNANEQIVGIFGPHGEGKTRIIREFSSLIGYPLVEIQAVKGATIESYLGSYTVDNGDIQYKLGVIPTAIKLGVGVHITEAQNMLSDPETSSLLHSLIGVNAHIGIPYYNNMRINMKDSSMVVLDFNAGDEQKQDFNVATISRVSKIYKTKYQFDELQKILDVGFRDIKREYGIETKKWKKIRDGFILLAQDFNNYIKSQGITDEERLISLREIENWISRYIVSTTNGYASPLEVLGGIISHPAFRDYENIFKEIFKKHL